MLQSQPPPDARLLRTPRYQRATSKPAKAALRRALTEQERRPGLWGVAAGCWGPA